MSSVTSEKAGPDLRGADKKEAFHREVESRIETFSFKRPDDIPAGRRAHYRLCKSDVVRGTVQIIPKGGDNNLHYHPGTDGFWMVLKGRVRFYGPDGLLGEFGPMEGILIPRNARYWFETASEEELHLLQVAGSSREKVNHRVDVEPTNEKYGKTLHYNYPTGESVANRQD